MKENLNKKFETKRDVQYKTAIAETEKKVYLAFSHPSKVTLHTDYFYLDSGDEDLFSS